MRSATVWVSRSFIGKTSRRSAACVVSAIASLLTLCTSAALAQSNVKNLTCPASQTFFLCKDGNQCVGTESPQDIVIVGNVTAGDTITFNVTHAGQNLAPPSVNVSPIQVDFMGQMGTGTPSPDPINVTEGGGTVSSSYAVTVADAADNQSRFQIQIDTNPSPQPNAFARVSYEVQCTKQPPPPAGKGKIVIQKSAINGDGSTQFDFTGDLGAFSLTPPVNGSVATNFDNLTPGVFQVSETPVPGWSTSVACSDPTSNTTTSNSTATIDVAADETVTCTFTNRRRTEDQTRERIRDFLNRRVDLLASNEPDRARMLRRFDRPQQPVASIKDGPMKLMGSSDAGGTQVSFATSLSQIARANVAAAQDKAHGGPMYLGATASPTYYSKSPGFDIWAEGHFQQYDDELAGHDQDGKFGILYFGTDYLVSRWLLVGALVQFDWMDQRTPSLSNAEVRGRGWMAGPYATVKLSENIFFDTRAAWGQSGNDITPFGTYTDSFDTDRWLAKANLTGNWNFGNLYVTPSVGVIYVEEEAETYVDSLGFTVAGQSVRLGRLTFGPEFRYPIHTSDGAILEPHASFTGMWDFDKDDSATIGGLLVSDDDFRVKIEGGLLAHNPNFSAASFRATVSYDGIGSDDFHAYGGQLWVNWPLN